MIFEGNCAICGTHFRRRYPKTRKAPICCSVKCGAIRLKNKWQDPGYRQKQSDSHKGNPGYWTGKERLAMRGAGNPKWKGGNRRIINGRGYICLLLPKYLGLGAQVLEHRWVMEKHLGRKLRKDEDVHHIDGVKTNNKIENLQVMGHSEHLAFEWKHHRKRLGPKPNNKICELCNKGFYHTLPKRRFCSIECFKKYVFIKSRKPHKVICRWCGKEFHTKRLTQKCCSTSCGAKKSYKTNRDKNADNQKPTK